MSAINKPLLSLGFCCSFLVLFIGALVLFDWATGLDLISSLHSSLFPPTAINTSYIPMAPSTSLLFVLSGLVVAIQLQHVGRNVYRIEQILALVILVVALVLLFLSSQNIFFNFEHIGLQLGSHKTGTPLGHMSPVTALFFIISVTSLLAAQGLFKKNTLKAFIGLGFSAVLFMLSLIFFLAYLFGAPLLYDGQFVPPALNTLTVFLILSVALFELNLGVSKNYLTGEEKQIKNPMHALWFFVAGSIAITSIAYIYQRQNEIDFHQLVTTQLTSITELKSREIQLMRKEWVDDTIFIKLSGFYQQWKTVKRQPTKLELLKLLEKLKKHDSYNEVAFFGSHGQLTASTLAKSENVSAVIVNQVQDILKSPHTVFQDFYRNEFDQKIYLATLEPVIDNEGALIGVFVLRIDPHTLLYPLINTWPTNSLTAETLLVRKEGDEVVFLNDVRFKEDSALTLRSPLTNKTLPAVQAVEGHSGIVEGPDYRNIQVIADVRAIANSPWFIVTRIDRSEVYAPLNERMWLTLMFVFFLITLLGVGLLVHWRNQRLGFYKEKYESTLQLEIYASAFSQNSEGVVVCDAHGNFILVNSAFTAITGYSSEEVLGKKPNILSSGQQSDEFYKAMWVSLRTNDSWQGEIWNRRKNGEVYPEWLRITALHDDKATHYIGVFSDITQRKKSEESMLLASLVYEHSSEAMVVGDAESHILMVNPAFTEVTGYSQDEVIGEKFNILKSGCQDNAFYEHLYHEINTVGVWQGEIFNKRKNGEIYPERLAINTIFNDDGSAYRYVALFSDISNQKEAQALAEAKELAEAATQAKSDFLANMSHEIRTPMNAIIGMTRLALQTNLDTTQQNYLNKVELSAESLLELINDILDLSKVESGKLELEKVDFSLQDILDKQIALFALSAEQKGLELRMDISDDVQLNLNGDSLRLSQVLINLTNNAIKFTETGQVCVSVSSNDQQDGMSALQFSIHDTGIGISPEQQEALFKPFNQADSSITRKYGGTGLGLAISKSLVELMGGEIWVESQEGLGSTFHFSVKMDKQNNTKIISRLSIDKPKSVRAIVVDRDAKTRSKLSSMLVKIGVRVEQISDADNAVKYLKEAGAFDRYKLLVLGNSETDGEEPVGLLQYVSTLSEPPMVIKVVENIPSVAEQESGNCIILSNLVTSSKLRDAIMPIQGLKVASSHGSVAKKVSVQQAIEHLRGAKILLVEDNEINSELAAILLESNGMHATVAENGQEALISLESQEFDGVLMDCQMPVMDGYTATRNIRLNKCWANLPILAMTANAMVEDKKKALAAGMNDHISKPLDVGKMLICMASWISPAKGRAVETVTDNANKVIKGSF